MAYNTNSIEAQAGTEFNLVMQKGYVEHINGKTFTAVLFDEDGEAEFRVKIPKKDKVSLHIGKILNFSVDKSSEMVIDFYESAKIVLAELISPVDIYKDVAVSMDNRHVVNENSLYQNKSLRRQRNYSWERVAESYESSSSDKVVFATIEKVEGKRIFTNNNRYN